MNINYNELLLYKIGGNLIEDYILSLAIFLISLSILEIFKYVILRKYRKIADKTENKLDDLIINIISAIKWPLYLLISIYISLKFIEIPEIVYKLINSLILVFITYYIVKGIEKIITYGANNFIAGKKGKEEKVDETLINLLSKISKVILWIFAIIIIIQNFGYNASTLVTGLGISGIAVAFALQNILRDIFASFSIFLDKPFKPGDYISAGKDQGTVIKIGLKSTRIRTLGGDILIISNKELTETRVHNFKRMEKRRVAFSLGVAYETPTEKLKKIPDIITKIIKQSDLTTVERVHFYEFGASSLIFKIVYFVNSRKYNLYMDIQQEINLKIKEVFEKENIEISYPTQKLFINKINK